VHAPPSIGGAFTALCALLPALGAQKSLAHLLGMMPCTLQLPRHQAAALLTVVAKKAGTVNGAPAPVANTSKAPAAGEAKVSNPATAVANTFMVLMAREAKALKECSPASADVAVPTEVVAAPVTVATAPGPFHPTGLVVEIIGTEVGDRGRSCEEHSNCGEVMAKDMVARLWKV
jgi:hypothetical protein